MSDAEGRLLCREWDFCIENRVAAFPEFETDVKLTSVKIESACSTSVFQTICRRIHDASEQLKHTCRKKKFSNLSFDKLAPLQSNRNIVIVKDDRGNCIVILDKISYAANDKRILNGNQFQALNNKNYN